MALMAALLLGLTACADDRPPGVIGHIEGFSGVVVADEPQAVLVARDVLSAGGLAGDAAVALGFTLAVTLPSSAGLGGGGLCVAYNGETNKIETLDFRPGVGGTSPAGAMAVPALARGLFALHARLGSWRWESLLTPAESLARFGFPVSRALHQRLIDLPPTFTPRAEGLSPFLAEGQILVLHDLAATLGRLRQRGAGVMHDGPLAREIVAGARTQGLILDQEALRAQVPQWIASETSRHGYETVARATQEGSLIPGAGSPGATGFVVADRKGNAVSCVLTMGRPFGTGRMLGDQGFLAASSELGGGEALAALLVINTNSKEFHAGIAGAGAQAPAGVSAAAQGLLDRKEAPDAALALAVKAGPAHVNVASCPEGIPPHPQSCRVGVEPRGAGYGLRSGT